VGRSHVAIALVGSIAVLPMAGCGGGGDFKDKPRPAVPIELSGVITNSSVTVEPSHLGAGPITLVISNLSAQAHTVTIEGGPKNTTDKVGPIQPQDTGTLQEDLLPGTYTVKAGSSHATFRELRPATLRIGKRRESSSGKVLLP
jgi:hypothetical protein